MAGRIINCKVTDEYVLGDGIIVGAAGSHKDVIIRLEFGEMWYGTTKTLVWVNAYGENPTFTILTTNLLEPGETEIYLVPIPAEAKEFPGTIMMTVKGVTVEGQIQKSATLNAVAKFTVLESRWGEEPEDINATLSEQLQAEVDTIKNKIILLDNQIAETEEYAQSANDSATSAEASKETAEQSANVAKYWGELAEEKVKGAVSSGGNKSITVMGGGVTDLYPYVQYHDQIVTPESLDDLAWDGKSYREIFQGNNAVYEDYNKSTSSWLGNSEDSPNVKFWIYGDSGSVTMSENTISGARSICFENTDITKANSYQFQSRRRYQYSQGDKFYLASMLRVDRISLGNQNPYPYHGCGLALRQTERVNSISAVATQTTNGFVATTAMEEIPADGDYAIYIGCIGGYHNTLCYIDTPVVVNLTNLFQTPPDKTTMDLLYHNYISLLNGSSTDSVEIATWSTSIPIEFSDEECVDAFMEEVNKKAAEIGMDKSWFLTPSGIALDDAVEVKLPYKRTDSDVVGETVTMMTHNESTTGNMARMAAAAIGYPELGRIWRKENLTIELGGSERRTYIISHGTDFEALESTTYSEKARPYLGAKGGTWGNSKSLIAVTRSDNGHLLAHAVTTTSGNTYTPMGKLTDLAELSLAGEDVSSQTIPDINGAVTLLVPSGATWLFDSYSYEVLYQSGADSFFNPASTTKVITAMVALDWCHNIQTEIVILNPLDNVGYSGDRFLMGQTMTMEAALQAMILLSSNSMAHAIARTIGKKILQTKNSLK